jgi:hypothetical protein
VDAAGGLELEIEQPVRDPAARLLLPEGGRQQLDGATALALVRSRHPEQLVAGEWQPVAVDPDLRVSTAAAVLTALVDEVQEAATRPLRLQSVAWAITGALSVDPRTSLRDLASLATAELPEVEVLPTRAPHSDVPARFATEETATALAAAGLSCAR